MHVLCAHCRNPIELAKIAVRQEIVCPACGTRSEMEPFAKLGWR